MPKVTHLLGSRAGLPESRTCALKHEPGKQMEEERKQVLENGVLS